MQAPPAAPGANPLPPDTVLYAGPARHTVKIGAYLGWLVVTLGLFAAGAAAMRLSALKGLPLWLASVVGLLGLGWTYLRHVTTRYKVSTRRVEIERGVLARELRSLELWRVLDVSYRQSVLDRIFGDGRITLVSTDQSDPQLVLHGLPNARALFETLRDAIQAARRSSRPMELVGQDGAAELA